MIGAVNLPPITQREPHESSEAALLDRDNPVIARRVEHPVADSHGLDRAGAIWRIHRRTGDEALIEHDAIVLTRVNLMQPFVVSDLDLATRTVRAHQDTDSLALGDRLFADA